MLEIRLQAYKHFCSLKNPQWGPDLSQINFNDYIYYSSPALTKQEIPNKIKQVFKQLNVPELKDRLVSGLNNQFDSEAIYHDVIEELKQKKVIFTNIETAIIQYPSLVKQYFGKLVSSHDNKYAALNTAV
jgi:Fe-S cluster assembly protein SufB